MTEESANPSSRYALISMCIVLVPAVVFSIVFPLSQDGTDYVRVTSILFLFSGACVLVGGFLGFLFGIPRTQQGEEPDAQNGEGRVSYRVNTNLEQISDWLTKILVGVGLTQINQVPGQAASLAAYFGAALGTNGDVYALAILLYFSVAGFLLSYLWTRLLFATALAHADTKTLEAVSREFRDTAERLDRSLTEVELKASKDASALLLLDNQLDPSDDVTADPDELEQQLLASSPSVKRQAFLLATQLRSDSWNDPDEKSKVALVIPVFRALLQDETERNSDKVYAELAYALKDQEQPDWKEAEEMLTLAIRIRGDWKLEGRRIYEFNRAVCRINLDPDFAVSKPCEQSTRTAILRDLKVAATRRKLREIIASDSTIQLWLNVNRVDDADVYPADAMPGSGGSPS